MEKKNGTILVVDDEPDVRLVISHMLTGAGYHAVLAGTGREGLAQVADLQPRAVLLDVMLPDLSGWDVCRTLKADPATASIPVVMLTARSELKDLVTGMQVGADDYVTKPFSKKRLLAAVEQFVSRDDDSAAVPIESPLDVPRIRSLLSDSVTRLPTVPLVIDRIREKLLVERELGVLYISLEKPGELEELYGWELSDQLLRELADLLKQQLGLLYESGDIVAASRPQATDFYVFHSMPQGTGEAIERVRRRAAELEEVLNSRVGGRFEDQIRQQISVYVGHGRVLYNPQIRIERLVYRAMKEAALLASSKEADQDRRLLEAFRDLVSGGTVDTYFQPIYSIDPLEIHGYEALTRGPRGTPFESPEVLFGFAHRTNVVWELEQLCLRSTTKNAERLEKDRALFVNVEAEIVRRIDDGGSAILEPLLELDREIVLEITERAAIGDYALFRTAVGKLRDQGFRIAIDDAGSGYASLQSIAELKPDYLKISSYLVSTLDTNPIRRDVVGMLLHLSQRMGATLIAEGVETDAELQRLVEMKVPLGQGFLLGRPEPA